MEIRKPLIEKRADPHIFKHDDGTYYFTATVPEYDRIILRTAKSVQDLSEATETVLWEKPSSGPLSHFIWAPEIHYIEGGFTIYFAAKGAKSLDHMVDPHQIYALRCCGNDPMADEWIVEGPVNTGWRSFSLDATVFTYDNKNYMVWAQMKNHEEGNSNIYIAEMKNYKELVLPATFLTQPEYDWECIGYKVNEGPAAVVVKNTIYLTYSASATDHNYCVGMLTMEAGNNPLQKTSWKKSKAPILVSNEKINEYGPGHNSFTRSEDNKKVLFVYHAREYKEIKGDPLYTITGILMLKNLRRW